MVTRSYDSLQQAEREIEEAQRRLRAKDDRGEHATLTIVYMDHTFETITIDRSSSWRIEEAMIVVKRGDGQRKYYPLVHVRTFLMRPRARGL